MRGTERASQRLFRGKIQEPEEIIIWLLTAF